MNMVKERSLGKPWGALFFLQLFYFLLQMPKRCI
ncbi:hypothetical protein DFQ01_101129 [Paenibacillus cellulosilyticus]|uniref:Uncharacterized protein n=1 Tax=Paenibacillus cellulosilyticus TaxID=375489 RepID=A0A2V2YZI7_9BACL|nr:hypothetical protein DFQ01_101129 [Paenibacillus cellulosilyticus]